METKTINDHPNGAESPVSLKAEIEKLTPREKKLTPTEYAVPIISLTSNPLIKKYAVSRQGKVVTIGLEFSFEIDEAWINETTGEKNLPNDYREYCIFKDSDPSIPNDIQPGLVIYFSTIGSNEVSLTIQNARGNGTKTNSGE